jgi:DNA repair exonuclease SbcCD ATPase subunit
MSTKRPKIQPSVVPAPQTKKQIENVLEAHRKLEKEIEELKNQRADTEAKLTQLLVNYLAAAPLSVDTAIARYEDWKARHKALEARITAVEKVRSVIDEHIKELKKTQAQAFGIVLQDQIGQLDKSKEKLQKL